MTVDVVEYLAGLHIYVYFGILGAVSSALKDLKLDPSFHIASESTTRFVVILGREHIKTLINYLKKLATDLDVPIRVEYYVMERGVSIIVVTRPPETDQVSNVYWHRKCIELLEDNHIKVVTVKEPRLHFKAVIIDNENR